MKKAILAIFVLACTVVSAQKPKTKPKTATTTSTQMTAADANKIVIFYNSTHKFLDEYFKVQDIYNYFDGASAAVQGIEYTADTDRLYNFDSFAQASEYMTSYVAANPSEYSNPINPTPAVGKENVTFFQNKWLAMEQESSKILSIYNDKKAQEIISGRFELRSKAKAKEAQAIVDEMKPLVEELYKNHQEVLDKLDELADEAESVVLQKHPLRNEILDMKKTLRITGKIAKLGMVENVDEFEKSLPELDKLMVSLNEMNEKYKTYQVANNLGRENGLRTDAKLFFNQVNDYITTINEIKTNYKTNKYRVDQFKTGYNLVGSQYENFVNHNND